MRNLNDYGMMRLAARLIKTGEFPAGTRAIEVLNAFGDHYQSRYRECPFSVLEREGSVEKPADFGFNGKPVVIQSEPDWFHREPEGGES